MRLCPNDVYLGPEDSGKWHCCYAVDDPDHVYVHPLGDLIDHHLDSDGTCVCGPTPELIDDGAGGDRWMLTHHSLDGREQKEPDRAEP